LVDTPKGQEGRPSKSLTLKQAVAVITAARTLPVIELHPGLKDVRRPAALMYAYIVLSLLVGVRTEEARALRWHHVDLAGGLDAPRATDLVREPDEPSRGQHRGDRPAGRARLHPDHRGRVPPGAAAGDHNRRPDHG